MGTARLTAVMGCDTSWLVGGPAVNARRALCVALLHLPSQHCVPNCRHIEMPTASRHPDMPIKIHAVALGKQKLRKEESVAVCLFPDEPSAGGPRGKMAKVARTAASVGTSDNLEFSLAGRLRQAGTTIAADVGPWALGLGEVSAGGRGDRISRKLRRLSRHGLLFPAGGTS